MNRLEDRLRDAFSAAAQTVPPERIGVMRETSRPARSRRLAPLAAAAAVAAVIIAASVITPLALAAGHQTRPPSTGTGGQSPANLGGPSDSTVATVPVVVGMQVQQATAVLEALPLSVTIVYQRGSAGAPGTVSRQSPAGGTRVPFGAVITLTVAGVPGSSASPASGVTRSPGTRTLSSSAFAVTISIPASWTPTPYYGGEPAYDGLSGWVELNAMVGGHGLRYACSLAATANVLHVYGLHPQITYRNFDGRPGCLILPSSDAVFQDRRSGGPTFQSGEVLVSYRRPLSGGYLYLVIDADPAHIVAIADSAQLHQ